MYRIRSRPKKLLWFHKVVIAVAAVLVIGIVALTLATVTSGGFTLANGEYLLDLFVGLFFVVTYLHREVVGRVLYDYDAFSIVRGRGDQGLAVPFKYSDLSRVLRRAPGCVVLQAPSEAEGFEMHSEAGGLRAVELTIRGNEDDIDHLCKSIKDAGIEISDDGMGDDPPDKLIAMMAFVFIGLAVMCYVIFKIAGPR